MTVVSNTPAGTTTYVLRRAVAGMLLGALAAQSFAAWVVDPSARVETRYDDNVRLRPTDEEAGSISTAQAQVRVRNVTEVSAITGAFGAALSRYDGVDSFDDPTRESLFANLGANRNLERGSVGLIGSFRRQDLLRYSSLISDVPPIGEEPEEPLPGEDGEEPPGDPDSGLVQRQVQRDRYSIAPSVAYRINPRTLTRLVYSYGETRYDDPAEVSTLQDNKNHDINLSVERDVSERDRVWVQSGFARFEPDINPESESWNAQVGWSRRIDERLRMTLGLGGRRTEQANEDSTGLLVNAQLDRQSARGVSRLSVQRSMLPSAYGELVETDRIGISHTERLSERLSWRFDLSAYSSEYEFSSSGQQGRSQEYLRATPSVRWAVAPAWSVEGSYVYTWTERKRDADPGTAASNSVGLSLIYAPPRRL